jgi:ribosomal protein S18 acetylase RimI-like enzyme
MLKIIPFEQKFLPEAASLFIQNFRALRRAVPVLPDNFEDPVRVTKQLVSLFAHCPGAVALEDGRLAGYLGWHLLSDFRQTGRKAAYCPEWGHAAAAENQARIYRALYRTASAAWFEAGCQIHAITLLGHDRAVVDTWFWNGFGLGVVDGVRPVVPLGAKPANGLEIRQANLADAEILAGLEAEHMRHYGAPPTLMMSSAPSSAAEFTELLRDPHNCAWLAFDGSQPAGYLRFEGSGHGAADVVDCEHAIANTGAYVRPAYRGRGAAPAMLDAALRIFAARGLTCCSVDFEAFNPEAAAFWPRYFETVCLSLFRVPERQPFLTV